MKNFGSNRSIDPENSFPVAAWKVDCSRELRGKELRLGLKLILAESDNWHQICSTSNCDETTIREKILSMTRKRGKFHNPYTKSGGILMGIVEEVSPDYENCPFEKGDTVISLSSTAGLPLHIEAIEEIDQNYNLIRCSGHAICFESTLLVKFEQAEDDDYTKNFLRALSEEENFQLLRHEVEATRIDRAAIVGSNFVEAVLYAQLLKDRNPDIRIMMIRENSVTEPMPLQREELLEVLFPLIQEIYFDGMENPVHTFEKMNSQDDIMQMDAVVNLENTVGSESLSALLVKDGGILFQAGRGNGRYSEILIADSLGKTIKNRRWDETGADSCENAAALVKNAGKVLKRLSAYFEQKSKEISFSHKDRKNGLPVARKIQNYIYRSPGTADMVNEVLNIAQYDCNVIIQGETGVGKEMVFNLINQSSPRRGQPCIKINCASIQENLAESEFFGYEKGAFTGAQAGGKEGYFEMADKGTLFLDEIGSLPMAMQSKLLRVLQEKSFFRVGGTEVKSVDVRVICANNVPLKQLVDEGKFREDLYYRLNICVIDVPPLRKRKEDIGCLANAFLLEYSRKYGIDKEFSKDAYLMLEEYHWPGNVRELENLVHRLYISEKGHVISADFVDTFLTERNPDDNIINFRRNIYKEETLDFNRIMDEQERRLIAYALKKEGSTRKAADFLNIPQTTFSRKKLKHHL